MTGSRNMDKLCPSCGHTKPLVEFGRDAGRKDGLYAYCKKCACARQYKYRPAPKPITTSAQRKEMARLRSNRWAKTNPEKRKAASLNWRRANLCSVREAGLAWQKANPGKVNANTAVRRAKKLKATPAWDSEFDDLVFHEAYALAKLRAKMTGIKWHVDHVVPLRSKVVCGLHTPNNIAVITANANVAKGNRYWPNMPGE